MFGKAVSLSDQIIDIEEGLSTLLDVSSPDPARARAVVDRMEALADRLRRMAPDEPFRQEREAWTAGFVLLNELRQIRISQHGSVDDRRADQLIRRYAQRLRRSQVILSQIQRQARLTDAGVMAVVYAMANFLGIQGGTIRNFGLLLYGADLRSIRRFDNWIENEVGPGKLLYLAADGRVFPSRRTVDWATVNCVWADCEVQLLKDILAEVTRKEEPQ